MSIMPQLKKKRHLMLFYLNKAVKIKKKKSQEILNIVK